MVAVTASGVEVLPAEPVDECGRLEALCSALSVENEHLWDEVFRLTGENERLRGRVGKLEGSWRRRGGRASVRRRVLARGAEVGSAAAGAGSRRSTVGMVIANRRGRLMSSVMHRLRAGVSVAGRSWRTGLSTSSRTSCPSRSRSGGGSRCLSASAGGAGVTIRAVTRSRRQMLWERPRACSARARSRWRAS